MLMYFDKQVCFGYTSLVTLNKHSPIEDKTRIIVKIYHLKLIVLQQQQQQKRNLTKQTTIPFGCICGFVCQLN